MQWATSALRMGNKSTLNSVVHHVHNICVQQLFCIVACENKGVIYDDQGICYQQGREL